MKKIPMPINIQYKNHFREQGYRTFFSSLDELKEKLNQYDINRHDIIFVRWNGIVFKKWDRFEKSYLDYIGDHHA